MAQHDMNIANQGFPATRADLNNALQALVSNSSGASAPSTTFANQWWYDTTNNKMYIRNEANNAWIEVATLDQTNNEWQITTGVVQAKDSDGLALKTDDGTTRLFIKDSDGTVSIGDVDATIDGLLAVRSDASSHAISIYEPVGANENWQIGVDADGDLGFYNSGSTTSSVVFDDSGNVGIGVTSTSHKLHVKNNTSGAASSVYVENDSATSGANAELRLVPDGNNFHIRSYPDADSSNANRTDIGSTAGSSYLTFSPSSSEKVRIDGSGRVLVGKTVVDNTTDGIRLDGDVDYVSIVRNGDAPLILNRRTTDGNIILLRQDAATIGQIGTAASDRVFLSVVGHGVALDASGNSILPSSESGGNLDNAIDLGATSSRYDDVYATNGTIQTSDEREKQQIASLTDAEMTAAKAISKLFKTFKWNDSVTDKGDNARTHAGVIAQQVETAMSDAGLDASDYAFFINTTWWETQTEVAAVEAVEAQDAVYEDVVIPAVEEVLDDDGNIVTEAQPERTEQRLVTEAVEPVEAKDAYTHIMSYYTQEEAPEGATERNRKGIRYPELLSFIGAATEQRLTSIEARLDALEG